MPGLAAPAKHYIYNRPPDEKAACYANNRRLARAFSMPGRGNMSVKSYKDKNGKTKYYCFFRYLNFDGQYLQKKKTGFLFSKDAKEYEKSFLEKISGSSTMSFQSLCDLYLADCKARLKPTTYRGKKYLFDSLLIPFFKNTPITDITPPMIRSWQNKLLSHTPAYSQTYIKNCNNQISALLNYAVKYYGLKSNPVRIAGTIGKKHSGRLDFWTLTEYNKFMDTLDAAAPFRIAYELLFFTGCRSGELLALTVKDFDAAAGTISINKNFAHLDGKDYILPPKTPKSNRVITLPSIVAQNLQDYIASLYDPDPDERLFSMLNKYSLAKTLKRTAAAAGIKSIRVHDLRHSHASLLIELGFSPLLISERLGHENIETTLQIYSHLYPNKANEVSEKLNQLLKTEQTNIKKDT